jgi:trimethylamine--corrinoid protein Co-methyltransferase
VSDGLTVCDALPEIDFVMSMFLPADVPPAAADRYQMAAMLRRTRKPIVYVTYDLAGCVDAVAMAEAVAGGPDDLRARPSIACYINVTTGLLHNAEALQKLLFLASKGLPSLYIPVVSGGTTGPITVAAGLALSNAGALAGVVLAQLKREGAPVGIPGFGGDALDMRTLVDPYCGPEPRGLAEALAHFYGLPMFALAGCTESKVVDQQAAAEASLMLMAAALSGGQIIHDLGYLESGLTGSLAQLAICAEIVAWIRCFTQPPVVDDETLALDLIDRAGPDGNYLAERHTRQHMRERWYPRLFERQPYHTWQNAGAQTLADRAAAHVSHLLATRQPQPLPPDVDKALDAIVERAG